MSNEYRPDIPDAKALYFRGQQGEYILVETQDGSASLYYQGRKIATFANRSAGYKGWRRAVRRWVEMQKSCRAEADQGRPHPLGLFIRMAQESV